MLRKLTAVGASVGVLLTASLAHAQAAVSADKAQGFGQQGEFIFSADRLVPLFSYTNQKTNLPTGPGVTNETQSTSQSGFSFLWGSTAPNSIFYTVPRLGFDYTIIDNLTIGGDVIVFFTVGGNQTTHTEFVNGNTTDVKIGNPGNTTFGFAPRVGYVLGLNDVLGLWLRGGVSYYNSQTKQDQFDPAGNKTQTNTDRIWTFGLDLDPQLVIAPTGHFAFTVGPTVDIPLAGKHTLEVDNVNGVSTSNSFGFSEFNVSITGGIMGWFGGP